VYSAKQTLRKGSTSACHLGWGSRGVCVGLGSVNAAPCQGTLLPPGIAPAAGERQCAAGGWMDGQTDRWMDGWMDGWRGGRMDGWMDGQMDGWTDG